MPRSWNVDLTEGHDITLAEEEGKELLWIADPGRERRPENGCWYREKNTPISGQVVKLGLEGRKVLSLTPPDLDRYQRENYWPTFIAVNEERHGATEIFG